MNFFIFSSLHYEYIHVHCIGYEFIHIPCRNYGKFTFSGRKPVRMGGYIFMIARQRVAGITKRSSL